MPTWFREYVLTSILGGLAALLLLAVAVEWAVLERQRGRDARILPAKTTAAPEPEIQQEDFQLPALDDYGQTVERPLFMENRRPGSDIVEPVAPPPPPTPMTLKLMGIVWTPQGRTALLVDARGKYKRLKLQDTLDGWQLVELDSDKVTMQQGDRREVLPLLKKRPKTAPPPGAPPQPGQPPRPGQQAQKPPQPSAPQEDMDAGEEMQDVPEDASEEDIPEEDTEAEPIEGE